MKKISVSMVLGAVIILLAAVMTAVMGYFPSGFAEHAGGEEALLLNLAKGPVEAEIGIFAAIYLFIAVCIIGGIMAIRQEMRIMHHH